MWGSKRLKMLPKPRLSALNNKDEDRGVLNARLCPSIKESLARLRPHEFNVKMWISSYDVNIWNRVKLRILTFLTIARSFMVGQINADSPSTDSACIDPHTRKSQQSIDLRIYLS